MFGREPAFLISVLAALVQAICILWIYDWNPSNAPQELWLAPLITAIGGGTTRQLVMPVQTVKDAGMKPETLNARAEANRTAGNLPGKK